jgi:hypothetical protein
MPADFRTLHANLDAAAPGRRWVENVARLNLHEDAEPDRLLAGDPDTGSAPLHELGGLPARVSLTVLLARSRTAATASASCSAAI